MSHHKQIQHHLSLKITIHKSRFKELL